MDRLYLLFAIVAEIIGTSALKASTGFTKLDASVLTIVSYVVAFFFLALALRTIPVGVAYAIWSGAGIVLISLIGWLLYRQSLDLPALVGIAFILCGVLVLNLFSKSALP